MKSITIDQAMRVLSKARAQMGGDRCLVLSLTGSELDDVNVNALVIQQENESGYVEVRAKHHDL